jgi:hypothetical protein
VVRFYRLMVAEAAKFPALANLMEEQITHGAHRHLVEGLLREEERRGRLALADPETAAELLLTMLVGAPQRALLFGLKPWERARCSRWIRVVGAVAASAGILSLILSSWISRNAERAQGWQLGKQSAATSWGTTAGSAAAGLVAGAAWQRRPLV